VFGWQGTRFQTRTGIRSFRSQYSMLEMCFSGHETVLVPDRYQKSASNEGWHEQWVKVPPEQESKPRSLNSRKEGN